MNWIRLWQGRQSLCLNHDRPVKGPVFGPFLTIHENPGTEIRCGDVGRLLIVNGVVFYGGMFYERWSVFSGTLADQDHGYLSHLCPDLAIPPIQHCDTLV